MPAKLITHAAVASYCFGLILFQACFSAKARNCTLRIFFPSTVCNLRRQRVHRRLWRVPGPPPGPERHRNVRYACLVHGLGDQVSTVKAQI